MEWEKSATLSAKSGKDVEVVIRSQGILLRISDPTDQYEGHAELLLTVPEAAELGAALVNAAAGG